MKEIIKYELIKEYPGSPKLGTIKQVTKNFNPQFEQEYWKRLRKVLFITEDGVEKRHLDNYYFVWYNCKTSGDRYPRTWLGMETQSSCRLVEDMFEINPDHKYFHNFSNALRCVYDNTPILTVNMLIEYGLEDKELFDKLRTYIKYNK